MTAKEKTEYRKTKQWIAFRFAVLLKRNYSCYMCTIIKKKGLHVHHLDSGTYGKETPKDVVVLCAGCHKLVHRLQSRTKNKININRFCSRLKELLS